MTGRAGCSLAAAATAAVSHPTANKRAYKNRRTVGPVAPAGEVFGSRITSTPWLSWLLRTIRNPKLGSAVHFVSTVPNGLIVTRIRHAMQSNIRRYGLNKTGF